ncbi:MAG: DUF72 domain-containing protein [Caldilineae bacterium]|nr:MAG: DUF72 domain-containing protein [Caldilineae bacterium]
MSRGLPVPGSPAQGPPASRGRRVYVGCAGWSIPKSLSASFPAEGSHLQRYAARLSAVEINSSFYRLHRPQTYARWAATTPPDFRFAVKMPRAITHYGRLQDLTVLPEFLAGPRELSEKLGPLLVQLPPSLVFARDVAERFFTALREQFAGRIACEPRHASWFGTEAEILLRRFRVARVAADPPPVPQAAVPGGWEEWTYYRLHGSPRLYYSSYADEALESLARRLQQDAKDKSEVWCIFNNTAAGAAHENALSLLARLERQDRD